MLLTTPQVADILNMHYKSVCYKLNQGHFKTAQKIGRDWLIESYEVLEVREKRQERLARLAKNKLK